MRNVSELENKVYVLQRELAQAEAELREARLAQLEIKVGDEVRSTSGSRFELFKVTSIDFPAYSSRAWIKGVPKKKDGSWGSRAMNLFSDWEKAI